MIRPIVKVRPLRNFVDVLFINIFNGSYAHTNCSKQMIADNIICCRNTMKAAWFQKAVKKVALVYQINFNC